MQLADYAAHKAAMLRFADALPVQTAAMMRHCHLSQQNNVLKSNPWISFPNACPLPGCFAESSAAMCDATVSSTLGSMLLVSYDTFFGHLPCATSTIASRLDGITFSILQYIGSFRIRTHCISKTHISYLTNSLRQPSTANVKVDAAVSGKWLAPNKISV